MTFFVKRKEYNIPLGWGWGHTPGTRARARDCAWACGPEESIQLACGRGVRMATGHTARHCAASGRFPVTRALPSSAALGFGPCLPLRTAAGSSTGPTIYLARSVWDVVSWRVSKTAGAVWTYRSWREHTHQRRRTALRCRCKTCNSINDKVQATLPSHGVIRA
jgi:hypothetical protein